LWRKPSRCYDLRARGDGLTAGQARMRISAGNDTV